MGYGTEGNSLVLHISIMFQSPNKEGVSITLSKSSFLCVLFHSRGGAQARSQACVSGVAKLSLGDHVMQNLRAYFIRYVIAIKWKMCVQKDIELSSMSQRSSLIIISL